MKTLSLLVVDDDPVIRLLLCQRLTKDNHMVSAVDKGQDALGLLRGDAQFDALITDLVLPDMDGIAVLEVAKSLRPTIEALVITGHASVDSAVEAMKKGAVDYLTKPINFDELSLRLDHIAIRQGLAKDARDILLAKEVTEQEAASTIQALEMRVSELQDALTAAAAILRDGGRDQEDKISQALAILNRT
ncbi:MAG: response regulator [Desulfobulbaceae bacterium]|nr:response regulator [Desulfobulbaceae bacterium]